MKKIAFTEKQKKITNIVVSSIQIALILLAVIVSIIVLVNPNIQNGKVSNASTKLLPVISNSMAGDKKDSFNKGDLIIAKKVKDATTLKVGDIITFNMVIGGNTVLNTHRIINIVQDSAGIRYITKGDNNPDYKIEEVTADKVLAVYSGKLKGVGSAIAWLQIPTNFLLVIVLPLILLFAYNIFLVIRMVMQSKINKVKAAQEGTLAIDEEEIKRKAIEDYLASNKDDNTNADNK